MRKPILLHLKLTLVFFALHYGAAIAQADFKKNDIYIEAGGNGLIYSLNYERQLLRKPGLGFRAGAGWIPNLCLAIPLGVNYLFNLKQNNFIEAGAGVTFFKSYMSLKANSWLKDADVVFTPSVGFRRHTTKNLLLRLTVLAAVLGNQRKKEVQPWVGLSVGKRF